jgi:hypothetical protein
MVRSLWLRTLAAGLVWTGVVCAQQSTPSSTGVQADQILTIREAGKGPQKCKVVKSWRTGDGQLAYQVRVIETGEMMTITEKTGVLGGKSQSGSMQIYHWGNRRSSPPGVPAPTGDKSAVLSSYGVKKSGAASAPANVSSPYMGNASSTRVPASASPYPTNAALAARPISTPHPDKDWRQSWIQSDDKPLRIEDKPSMKESIADAPQLRIEGKAPVKGIATKSPPTSSEAPSPVKALAAKTLEKQSETIAKAPDGMPSKSEKGAETLLRLPAGKDIAVMDITPRTKSVATNSKGTSSIVVHKPALPERTSIELPGVTDLTGTAPESRTIKPAQKPDTMIIKLPDPQGLSAKPTVPNLPGSTPEHLGMEIPKPTEPPVIAASPTPRPQIPEMVQSSKAPGLTTPPTLVAPAVDSPKAMTVPVGSATPVIPQMAARQPLPATPLPAVAPEVFAPAVKLAPPPQAERPNFLVMDASKAQGKDHSIMLPGVPSAVVTFGQPVTVTSPPPDTVRKKSLESHSIKVMLDQLRDSVFPSQREWAAGALCSANWKVHPEIAEALCKAAVEDPAPTVRARCLNTLAKMDERSARTMDTIHKLQADKDESVRAQADEAVKSLAPAATPHE